MLPFSEWLRESNKKFKFLPDIIVNNKLINWNVMKSEEKFLSQINSRVKVQHVTNSEILGKIIEKGLNLKYNECAYGLGRDNDTCIYFRKSLFVVIFNKDSHSIIGIRNPNDDLRYKDMKVVFEDKSTNEIYDNRLEIFCKDYLDIDSINIGEIYEGIKFNLQDGFKTTIATNVCKVCLEVDL